MKLFLCIIYTILIICQYFVAYGHAKKRETEQTMVSCTVLLFDALTLTAVLISR